MPNGRLSAPKRKRLVALAAAAGLAVVGTARTKLADALSGFVKPFVSARQLSANWELTDGDTPCEQVLTLRVANACFVARSEIVDHVIVTLTPIESERVAACDASPSPYGVKKPHSYVMRLRDDRVIVTYPASIAEKTETRALPTKIGLLRDATLVLTCDGADRLEAISIRFDASARTKRFAVHATATLPDASVHEHDFRL